MISKVYIRELLYNEMIRILEDYSPKKESCMYDLMKLKEALVALLETYEPIIWNVSRETPNL